MALPPPEPITALGEATFTAPSCTPVGYQQRPCTRCPWRRDVTPGQFSRERLESMRATSGEPGREAGLDAPLFACHKSLPGHDLACAGWLAVAGYLHLRVRLLVSTRQLPAEVWQPGPDWPPLHSSFDDMVATKTTDQHRPSAAGG